MLVGEQLANRIAIELRNRNWVEGEQLKATLDFLRAHSAAFVLVDAPPERHFTIMPPDLNEITNPQLAYLRLHGRDVRAYTTGKTVASRFNYDYSDGEIGEVAQRARRLGEGAKEVHVVFNNNALDYGIGADPANASGIFLTTVTDVASVGLLLGLGTVLLL
jgi:uncharacterized protein YecE (DUF72 family)